MIVANPDFAFSLFYNLQRGNVTFNTLTNLVFKPTAFHAMADDDLRRNLSAFFDVANVRSINVTFKRQQSQKEWQKALAPVPLNRMFQYRAVQGSILNMYSLQVACAAEIREAEDENAPFASSSTRCVTTVLVTLWRWPSSWQARTVSRLRTERRRARSRSG